MDLIKNEVMQIQKVSHVQTCSSGRPASTWQNSAMVDFDDVLFTEVLDKLTGHRCDLQIVPIAGMGGIGKTTFARSIYQNQLIVQHFDICVWVTVSEQYSVRNILSEVLSQENRGTNMSECELGERVHKKLWGRRYLIVMDDIWSIEPWDKVKLFFPDNNNGSRIMITTRLSNLASDLSDSQVLEMDFLNEDQSWNLLCEIVFGKEPSCPVELENIGMEIAMRCRGLPLSIVVIGGLLKKSHWTQAHWELTLQNLNQLINLENGEYCLQILRKSYMELPMYLKPCFLYMGAFREDYEFHVSDLMKLWVAEGILRPTEDKRLEEVAQECIDELIDRNLVLVNAWRWNWEAKVCKIHDLLRDLSIREAKKQKFLRVIKHHQGLNVLQCMNMERRVCIHNAQLDYSPEFRHALESALLTRSLILTWDIRVPFKALGFRLLRVYSEVQKCDGIGCLVEGIFQNVNLRCLIINLDLEKLSSIPSPRLLLWNMQTLKVDNRYFKSTTPPPDIWEMPLLRHFIISRLQLQDPVDGENDLILEDLQTLAWVTNLKLSRRVIKRVPNLKTLKLYYELFDGKTQCLHFSVNKLGHLKKLQSLNVVVNDFSFQRYSVQNLKLPHSLKKLSLHGTMLSWDVCTTKIGSLPLLEFLRLENDACCGPEWETVEGKFGSLRILQITECDELRYWRTNDTHFARLEYLVLRGMKELEEIPSCIGDIPTLDSIYLGNCSTSVTDSANRIKKEQMELGNEDLQVRTLQE